MRKTLMVVLVTVTAGLCAASKVARAGSSNAPPPVGAYTFGFEAGGSGNPFVPDGWSNGEGECAFQPGELTIRTVDPLSGKRSLEINTMGRGEVKRKLCIRLAVDVSTPYEISFKGRYIRGEYVSISARNAIAGGDTSFIQAIGNVGIKGSIGRKRIIGDPKVRTVTGELNWPAEWLVFLPLDRNAPVLPKEVLKCMPESIPVAGNAIPGRKVKADDNRVDFAPLFKGVKLENMAYAFLALDSHKAQKVTLGLGADWWLQAWVNGEPVMDTLAKGNVNWPPSITDHTVEVTLKPGRNVLAVRFISGAGSSVLALGGPDQLRVADKDARQGPISGSCRDRLLFDVSHSYLVIQTHGEVNAVLDDIAIEPLIGQDPDTGFSYQHLPWTRDWQANHLSEELETPHTKWAKPYAGGELKVVSLLPRWWHRWTIELAQRMSVSYEPVMLNQWLDRSGIGQRGLGGDYWIKGKNGEPEVFRAEQNALDKLSGPLDCIVIAYANSDILPHWLVTAILDKVHDGTGLVLIGSGHKEVWSKAVNDANRIKNGTDYVALGLVMKGAGEFYRHGKGRIGFFASGRGPVGPAVVACSRAEFEMQSAYLIKGILWASNRMPAVYMSHFTLPGTPTVDQRSAGLVHNMISVFCEQIPVAVHNSVLREQLPAAVEVKFSHPLSEAGTLVWWFDDYTTSGRKIRGGELLLAVGRDSARMDIPRLPGGEHWLHLQLKAKQGRIIDWNSVGLQVVSTPGIKEILLTKDKPPYYKAGERIEGRVVLDATAGKGHRVRLRLADVNGHRWREETLGPVQGSEIGFSTPIDKAVVLMHILEADLLGPDGQVIDSCAREITIARKDDWYKNRYDFQMWQIPWEECDPVNYLAYLVAGELGKYGVTSSYRGFARVNAFANIRAIPTTGDNAPSGAEPGAIAGDKTHAPERSPSLSDPTFRQTIVARIEKTLSGPSQGNYGGLLDSLPYAPLAYEAFHEVNLLDYGDIQGITEADIDFSKPGLESFRTLMREEYGTLAALNLSWGTDFKKWEAVRPIVLAEAIKTGQIARWIDHRRHMDRVFTGFPTLKKAVVRRYDPGAQMIADNPRNPTSYSGVDWPLLNDVVSGSAMPYLRDFVPADRRHLTWGRYQYWHSDVMSPDDDLFRRRIEGSVWSGLLDGLGGSGLWVMSFHNSLLTPDDPYFRQVMAPDLRLTEDGRWSVEPVAQIRTGIDRLIFESERDHSGIAILYSRSSEHAATAWAGIHGGAIAKRFAPDYSGNQLGLFASALRLTGYQSIVISERQIAQGMLKEKGIRLLILPFSQAVDARVTTVIKEFVAAGGMVLADLRPAVADGHGHTAAQGLLDDVFGVVHPTGWADYRPEKAVLRLVGEAEGLKPDMAEVQVIAGPAVTAATAKSIGKIGDTPVMLVNRYGAGKAVLLNFTPLVAGKGMADMMERVLSWGGLTPLFGVETLKITYPEYNQPVKIAPVSTEKTVEVYDAEVYMSGGVIREIIRPTLDHFTNGNIHTFAVRYVYNKDGIRGVGTERLRITPPKAGHIYDLKNNQYLGNHNRFEVDIPLESVNVYAVVPYRIETPELAVQLVKTKAGNPVIECRITTSPRAAAGARHVVRMRLYAPDGREWGEFAENIVAEGGAGTHQFVLPLNAPAGVWKVEARESISGLTTAASVSK